MTNYLGIDLSSQPERTAVCVLQQNTPNVFKIQEMKIGCNDAQLHDFIKQTKFIGIDAPFGWPIAFQNAVTTWNTCDWNDSMVWEKVLEGKKILQEKLRLRETDRRLQEMKIGVTPLSVSTDKISLPAMRAMLLLKRFGVKDKTGMTPFNDKHFYEVYPAATLACWKMNRAGYKKADAISIRQKIVEQITQKFSFVDSADDLISCTKTDHQLDALICALTAFKASIKQTNWPPPSDLDESVIHQEGWIHLPI